MRQLASRRIIPAYAGSTTTSPPSSAPAADHPRIRGEHSFSITNFNTDWGSSPHTRGAPTRRLALPPNHRIIPAYAGSTPPSSAIRANHRDHPRIRGEHRRRLVGDRRGGRIIPAYAGSTAHLAAEGNSVWDHPRIRGEHPFQYRWAVEDQGSSPHTRGARRRCGPCRRCGRIIPAYAGSTPPHPTAPSSTPDHPRIRGEHVDPITIGIGQWGSSPHTRGAQVPVPLLQRSARIIPAYAGSTWGCTWLGMVTTDHPRIRGEHVHIEAPRCPQMGSSPHTRGARRHWPARRTRSRIIPAYAGSTSAAAASCLRLWDHPRIRGEHCCWGALVFPPGGSSPHTRGARHRRRPDGRPARIIPAYAGSTHHQSRRLGGRKDHPRIRGEHPRRGAGPHRGAGSSPHTRGARGPPAGDSCPPGIIPAYAGSTTGPAPRRPRRGDHPRIRGEHLIVPLSTHFFLGSSPHTRGAHGRSDVEGRSRRIIPAYAGSTVHWSPERWRQWDHPRIRGEHRI